MTTTFILASLVTLPLYALLTTAGYYLLARAMITQFVWSRYPAWLDYYTLCAACSGVLYGVVVALALGWTQNLPFLLLPGRFWLTPIVVGFCSMIWTPILADAHVNALLQLGVADPRLQEPNSETPDEVQHAEKA